MGLLSVQAYNLHQHEIQDIWHLENKWRNLFLQPKSFKVY